MEKRRVLAQGLVGGAPPGRRTVASQGSAVSWIASKMPRGQRQGLQRAASVPAPQSQGGGARVEGLGVTAAQLEEAKF